MAQTLLLAALLTSPVAAQLTPRTMPLGQPVMLWLDRASAGVIAPPTYTRGEVVGVRVQVASDRYVTLVGLSSQGRPFPLPGHSAPVFVAPGSVHVAEVHTTNLPDGVTRIVAVPGERPVLFARAAVQAKALVAAKPLNGAAQVSFVLRAHGVTIPLPQDLRPLRP
ncbi:hypothetical protein [Deinococcus enclensis]|uniref:DUF4384 domain-containing protein n=1 Tax=Deinococcus enclensis TaxID=1049582 RepID=A0ABT9MF06_9DEIO|nr:hypothetical protein [Deinococcus enclensis]MDP9765187.1 hypothetical protein [Deinococcus enclensis]